MSGENDHVCAAVNQQQLSTLDSNNQQANAAQKTLWLLYVVTAHLKADKKPL